MQVYAAYAACVGMNNILPANLGTFVMFAMLTAVIASATYAGMIGGFLVEKIFFTVAGAFVYLYLFLTVPGSFDIDFSWIKEHPWATATLVMAAGFVIAFVARTFWPKVTLPRLSRIVRGGRSAGLHYSCGAFVETHLDQVVR
jgi:hypothetical protein